MLRYWQAATSALWAVTRSPSSKWILHFTALKALWEELDCYRPFLTCVCLVKCNCIASTDNANHRQQDYILVFLFGLNNDFAGARSQILFTDPVPPLNKVFFNKSTKILMVWLMIKSLLWTQLMLIADKGRVVELQTPPLAMALWKCVYSLWESRSQGRCVLPQAQIPVGISPLGYFDHTQCRRRSWWRHRGRHHSSWPTTVPHLMRTNITV